MEKKLRRSQQREKIYQYLLSTAEHPSADMVYERLRGEIPSLSLGTVYRNLKLLEQTGRIRRVSTLQNVERYDARCGDHAHFVCEQCGSVTDLESAGLWQLVKRCNIGAGCEVSRINVVFGGRCAACNNKSPR